MADATQVKRTGMIGLGAMGLQMAKHMVLKGFEVTGYDVSADAAKRAEGLGVRERG
jgi:3-hydroxyisobutyrate dehydrogenase-like beta-hydroxyacid dehydrogenase